VEEIVQGLGELQPRGAGTRRSWYDWLEKPETVSALAALAAMHVLGPSGAAEVMFGDAGTSELGAENAALEELRVLFAQVQEELGEQRRETMELRQQMNQLVGQGGRQVAHPGSYPHPPTEVGELSRLITGLEAQVHELGRKMDSPWARDPGDPSESGREGDEDSTERLSHRVHTLQARMIEIRSMIGQPWIAEAASSGPSVASDPADVMAWVAEAVHTLLQQVAEANAHPAIASITAAESSAEARKRSG
jgi:hypothetical protein